MESIWVTAHMLLTVSYGSRYLIEKAKAEKDWEEAVPYEKKIRGKVFVPKKVEVQVSQKELSDMGFDVEFDDDVNEVSKL